MICAVVRFACAAEMPVAPVEDVATDALAELAVMFDWVDGGGPFWGSGFGRWAYLSPYDLNRLLFCASQDFTCICRMPNTTAILVTNKNV
jgi:hypothetical protein